MRNLRDPNRKPTHPGELLFHDVLPALGMTQTELADRLGVSRLTVSELLHGKRALSADMAVRLARLLRTTPESWLNMQQTVDLWELAQADARYRRIKPVAKVGAGFA
ncbi:MAG: HigA family addiction module antidote protein [Candidatus Rokubacteria bacterium]|nr:HigA family addiction module antidote protein [Candidatus Rokubacteria bacterium]